jgi:predicted transcriptional regulator
LAVAKLLAQRKLGEAMDWIERGCALDREKQWSGVAYELERLRREVLSKLGRQDDARAAAWVDFLQHPSKFSYQDLMTIVPKLERKEWHEKALDGAATGADLGSLLELFTATKETERLAKLVRGSSHEALKNVSHSFTEPAAKRLEKDHPSCRLPVVGTRNSQGMRVVDAKKSKYYDASLSNFSVARGCYQRAGLATGRRVSSLHFRKSGFMNGFHALAAGAKRVERPSFLERAKARWGERHRNHS